METSGTSLSSSSSPSPSGSGTGTITSSNNSYSNSPMRFGGLQLPSLSLFESPLSVLLEHSSILPASSSRHHDTENESLNVTDSRTTTSSTQEVSIGIIGPDGSAESIGSEEEVGVVERVPVVTPPRGRADDNGLADGVSGDSSSQRYIQQVARWIEQILPFTLLLLVVFIRQHLQEGDLCAICQEKMHAPILLCCKHIFCEDCVSEWFERERTCPLCRVLIKPADGQTFGDGSTSLFFQLF